MKIAKNFDLPEDAVTQTFGYIARKGGGKTYAATKMCELFLSQGVQCIALDPVGNWYGLRLDKSGEKPSEFNIPIFGGEHGDIPLDYRSGAIVANFLLETGSSAVLDVSSFRKGQRKEFVADFAEELFHKQKSRRIPLHLFIEEAQVFIPQRPGDREQRMLGAMEDIVRLGRNYGIGVSLNTQRPQSVNKEVLNQVEPLVVFQLTGSHERKAIQEWVSYAGAEVKEQLATLPALAKGDGFFWSPAWMRKFAPIRFLPKKSFDASATPTLGETHFEPKALSAAKLENLSEQMQSMVDQAAENDPAALKRKVKSLERELNKAARGVPETEVNRRIREALEQQQKEQGTGISADQLRPAMAALDKLNAAMSGLATGAPTTRSRPAVATRTTQSQPLPPVNPDCVLSGPEQRILNALAWWEATGINAPYSHIQVAFIAGYSPKSSGFTNPLGRLKSAGLVDYPLPKTVGFTEAGRGEAVPVESPPTQKELHDRIMAKLSGPQQRILRPLLDCYPGEMSKEELASAAGYSFSSSGFTNPLGNLKSLGLVTYPRAGVALASETLFLD